MTRTEYNEEKLMKRFTLKTLAATFLFAFAGVSQAAFPDKPIKLVVPFPPGGTTDVVARQVAPKAAEILGQPIIIENKGGAGASIGSDFVAKSPADGYTLLVATNSHTANPFIYKSLPYDTVKDFTSIALIGDNPGIFVVHPSVPANNVKEFVAYAKAANPPLGFGSAGAGTYPHLSAELFKDQAGIPMMHVPYKGAGPALIDLLGGVYQFKVEGSATAMAHIKAGKLKALGVTSRERIAAAPDLPTVAEQGYPEYETNFWMAILGPANMPKDVKDKLEAAFVKALKDKDLIAKLEGLSVRVMGGSANDTDALITKELKMWPPIVKKAGITAN
ncbi:MAG: tripartite tricarboxylate transporter substrate binding protein [Usitatibacter sp.]